MKDRTYDHIQAVYITDIDGTLMDPTHRAHYLELTPPHWDAFYNQAHRDTPIHDVADVVRAVMNVDPDHTALIVVSGRRESLGEVTRSQLFSLGLSPELMYLRREGDKRKDEQVKLEALAEIRERFRFAEIRGVFEDRQRVVDMWRREGLTVFQVAEGNF